MPEDVENAEAGSGPGQHHAVIQRTHCTEFEPKRHLPAQKNKINHKTNRLPHNSPLFYDIAIANFIMANKK